jgi:diadenylate cyclase
MNILNILWSQYLVNIIDILIVTYIIYRIILLLKGTRAVQILIGILILLIITFFAHDIFNFRTLSWMLENFWLAAVVIIAVVFQPEIRYALVQLGSQHWTKLISMPEPSYINEVIEAIKEISDRKEGALIVFEKDVGLKEYIETGTMVNATISRDLIVSLFNKESPLHDGAVIIRDGRLVAAGCVLPLSSSESKLSKTFGTRHSAGLGLSEITDAIVIIVSEETTKVSAAVSGKITGNVDPDQLRLNLMDSFWKTSRKSVFSKIGLK